MTVVTAQLSESLQTLVDARLDTLDRMLLGRVSRGDRVAIVSEVESQIYELLQGRNAEELTRDDVLTVLSKLDPPEAYLPDDLDNEFVAPRALSSPRTAPPASAEVPRAAKASGIVGLSTAAVIVLSPLLYVVAALMESDGLAVALLFGVLPLMFLGGAVSVALACYSRLKGAWGVTGLVTGIISLLVSLAAGVLLLMDL
jgi:hypothetical protein